MNCYSTHNVVQTTPTHAGIYFYPLHVKCAISNEPLFKIGRASNILHRVESESTETLCVCSPYTSPDTMCILVKGGYEVSIENLIRRRFKNQALKNNNGRMKEIFKSISFKSLIAYLEYEPTFRIEYTICRLIDLKSNIYYKCCSGFYDRAVIIRGPNRCRIDNTTKQSRINSNGRRERVEKLANSTTRVQDLLQKKPITYSKAVKDENGVYVPDYTRYTRSDFKYDLQFGYVTIKYTSILDQLVDVLKHKYHTYK